MNHRSMELANVLLVDDSLAETTLAEAALRREQVHLHFSSFREGEQIIDYLHRQNEVGSMPDLVLLDINLPTMDGKDILAMMKQDALLKDIPVVMYSGSDAPSDLEDTKALGALDYMVKPLSYAKLHDVVAGIARLQFQENEKDKYLYRVDG